MAGDRSREQSEYEVDGPSPQISFVPVSKSRLQEIPRGGNNSRSTSSAVIAYLYIRYALKDRSEISPFRHSE